VAEWAFADPDARRNCPPPGCNDEAGGPDLERSSLQTSHKRPARRPALPQFGPKNSYVCRPSAVVASARSFFQTQSR
jgi:hypothetical protein